MFLNPCIYACMFDDQFIFDQQVKIEKGAHQHTVQTTVKATNAKNTHGTHAGKDNSPTFGVITKETRRAREQLLSGKNKV
jgi:hypothetical protein